jgi:hypothetical protein
VPWWGVDEGDGGVAGPIREWKGECL